MSDDMIRRPELGMGDDPFLRRGIIRADRPRCDHTWTSARPEPGEEGHTHRCTRAVHRFASQHVCACGSQRRGDYPGPKVGGKGGRKTGVERLS